MDDFVYKFFSEGFFGYGEEGDFTYFSFAHFAPIILLIVGVFLVWKFRDKIREWKWEENFRYIVAGLIILNESFYYWRLLYVGNGGSGDQLITYLPLQVCEWSAFVVGFMLMKKSRHLYDIGFYICLTLGLIPLFTPAVIMTAGPSYFRYYQFWMQHILPIFGVLYMTIVHCFRPNWRKVYKPLALLVVLAGFAILANTYIEGANFMYLAETTDGDSIANILPENIGLRLLVGVALVSVLFTIVSIPQIISEVKAKKLKTKMDAENLEEKK